jgi:deoxyuridine 5'-triphosphate nucleotidohydrolase
MDHGSSKVTKSNDHGFELDVYVQLINGGKLPTKADEDDAGWDLYANSTPGRDVPVPERYPCIPDCKAENCDNCKPILGTIHVGCVAKFGVGFALAIPKGWEADVRPRSGMGTKYRVVPPNTPGTIDSKYRDEMIVHLENRGISPYVVRRGDRIAQMLFLPVPKVFWHQVDMLPGGNRGGGFGHSGR